MKYDFDEIIDRRNTDSRKWDTAEKWVGEKDVLPLWIADMDFQSPYPVIEALRKRVEHGVFGYAKVPDSCYEAIIGWMKKRHGWDIKQEWIMFTPGIVAAFHWAVGSYAGPGDGVIIQPPVYHPFFRAVKNNGCQMVENQLKYDRGRYAIDFDDLETACDSRTKMLLLCSPHNPVGRVWTKEELIRLAELCLKHQIVICSDEIHCDVLFRGYRHIPTAIISEEVAQNTVTCVAANKTFNIAGLNTGVVIIPNPRLREKFRNTQRNTGINSCNLLGIIATEVAYTHGEEWLEQVLDYLQGNLEFLTSFVEKKIAPIKVIQPEGTYLAWLDCQGLRLNDAALKDFMLKKAKVWLNDGPTFGNGGSGFQRINLGCSRFILREALQRIEQAVKEKNFLSAYRHPDN